MPHSEGTRISRCGGEASFEKGISESPDFGCSTAPSDPSRLFMPERHNGIYTSSASSRDEGGDNGYHHEQENSAQNRKWIERAKAIQLASDHASTCNGESHAESSANGKHHPGFLQHHADHSSRCGAQGHAYPNFIGPPGNPIGKHAIEPPGRQQQAHCPKNSAEPCNHARLRHAVLQGLCQLVVFCGIQVRISADNRFAHCGQHLLWVARRTNLKRGPLIRAIHPLVTGDIKAWRHLPAQTVVARIPGHAYHFHNIPLVAGAFSNMPADRIAPGKKLIGKCLVNHSHMGRTCAVLQTKFTAT